MLTLAFLSHHSKHLITKLVKDITSYNLDLSILIIENSQDISLKKELEKNYENQVEVFIPKENLGFSKGMNKAIELSKNNFVFLNPADVILSKDCLINLMTCIKNFDNFVLLAPTYTDESVYKNYERDIFSEKNKTKEKINLLNKYNLEEIDWIDGTFIVNKSMLKNLKIMDEKFFIYFETMDMCLNFKKNNQKMYIVNNIKFDHLGGKSHDKKFNYEANLSRNWHYNWSKFYYFKKNYSYVYALKKSFSILLKLTIKLISRLILNKTQESSLVKAELNGILASIFLKESSYRPYIKK